MKFCISVSPDERWLTFVEWTFPPEVRQEEQLSDEYDARIASMDLRTGARTQHSIESISRGALGFSDDDKQWKYHAGFRIIKEGFRPPGWRGGEVLFPAILTCHVSCTRTVEIRDRDCCQTSHKWRV